jgi:hypothetical protein
MAPDIAFDHTFIPSSDEKAALGGTAGTPSGTNKFVTNSDTRVPTADQAAALAGAGGYTPNATNLFATANYVQSVLDGLDWQESIGKGVSYYKAGAPIGTAAAEGELCLDLTNKKLYEFTSGAWDAGSALTSGDRLCHYITGTDTSGDSGTHTPSNKIYRYDGTTITQITPNLGYAALFEDTDERRTYNGATWVLFDSGSSHNSLSGLQGGTTGQYYHMTSDEDAALAGAADALSSTNPVLGKADKSRVPTPIEFVFRGGVGQSQTDVGMYDSGDMFNDGVPQYRSGYIVGMLLKSNSARTAGTLTAEPAINGTDITPAGLDLALNGTDTTVDYANVAEGTSGYSFSTGDRLRPNLTSDGTWATASGVEDIKVVMYVVYS